MAVNPNIIKIITILIILGVFTGIIYLVAKVFAKQCPNGLHYDTDQKKCIDTCTDDEIYNNKTQKCRPVCTPPVIWSDTLNTCKDCGSGSTWDEDTQTCIAFCIDDKSCDSGQSCVNNRCCSYPACKTKDGDKCCQNCTPDTNNPNLNICCSQLQTCSINGKSVCCQGAQICNENVCVDPCGPKGSTIGCKAGEQCLQIKNVTQSSNMYKQLSLNKNNQVEKNVDGTYNFYSCIDENNTCMSSPAFSVPASVQNFYPCFDIDKSNTDTGLGFCSSKDTDTVHINICKLNSSKSICTENNNCQWYDLLSTNKENIDELNNKISQTFEEDNGYYCGDQTKNLSRLYGTTFDTSYKCGFENCVAFTANPTVTDVYYDATTGNCTSLQSCTTKGNLGTNLTNKSTGEIIPTSCAITGNLDCAQFANSSQICDPSTGLIRNFGYNCLKPGTQSIQRDGTCICNKTYAGTNCQYSDAITCNNNGIVDKDGNCTCNTPPNHNYYGLFYGPTCNIPIGADLINGKFVPWSVRDIKVTEDNLPAFGGGGGGGYEALMSILFAPGVNIDWFINNNSIPSQIHNVSVTYKNQQYNIMAFSFTSDQWNTKDFYYSFPSSVCKNTCYIKLTFQDNNIPFSYSPVNSDSFPITNVMSNGNSSPNGKTWFLIGMEGCQG